MGASVRPLAVPADSKSMAVKLVSEMVMRKRKGKLEKIQTQAFQM
jgi:hypothetical protein